MEFNKKEAAAVVEAIENAAQEQVVELHDVQLALVGGGAGDVVFH